MSEIAVTSLSLPEKIHHMERLWVSLESDKDFEPPAWHGEVLEERTAKLESGQAEILTLEQLDEVLDHPGS